MKHTNMKTRGCMYLIQSYAQFSVNRSIFGTTPINPWN